ncbi:MAG: energy transducer TonB [Gammaproteobacteria bacterium]|nr:energy transducer TonB [Gammaproteobacteria bacterium]MDH4314223.1 energy transducer TonB [Gammaproteobacteria bacterium]MDH5213254.1 energy transducer TonB [Gammaproteobacteria bacterium]
MATNSDDLGLNLGLLGLQSLPAPDRLPPMLFLAALIHGILIIGVTFNAALGNPFKEAISLEVTIVADPDKSYDAPDEAAYLAQASQKGAGNTDDTARPAAPLQSNMPFDNPGENDGNSLLDSNTHQEVSDQLLTTRTRQPRKVVDNPRDEPRAERSTALALESGTETTLPLPRDDVANLLIRDDNPRQLVTSVDTKESNVAGYLDRWKRKIESIGVKYFPEKGITQGLTGSPTLEVTIDSSGQLGEVIVRNSSGSKILDQAALNILRRAAPFEPFPESIRVDFDQLRFAYKWQFAEIGAETTARAN